MKKLNSLLKSKLYRYDDKGMIHFVLSSLYHPKSVLPTKHFPASFPIKGDDIIWDEEEKKQRRIRLIPGEESIFADEQSDSTSAADKNIAYIIFKNGFVSLREMEKTTLSFLILSNHNKATEKRMPNKEAFYEVWQKDNHKEELVVNDELVTIAKYKLMEMCKSDDGLNQVKSFAMVWGINTNQEISSIKHDLNLRITKDPQGFLDGLESKNMKRKYYILQAIKDKVILKDDANNHIKWANDSTILAAPVGIDTVDYLVEKSFDDMANVYSLIKEKVLDQLSFKEGVKKAADEEAKDKAELEELRSSQAEERKEQGLGAPAFPKKHWKTIQKENKESAEA